MWFRRAPTEKSKSFFSFPQATLHQGDLWSWFLASVLLGDFPLCLFALILGNFLNFSFWIYNLVFSHSQFTILPLLSLRVLYNDSKPQEHVQVLKGSFFITVNCHVKAVFSYCIYAHILHVCICNTYVM